MSSGKRHESPTLFDTLRNGRRVRVLNIIDDSTREVLAAHADHSICFQKVVDHLKSERGLPKSIRTDNGPRDGRRNLSVRNWLNGVIMSGSNKNLSSRETHAKWI